LALRDYGSEELGDQSTSKDQLRQRDGRCLRHCGSMPVALSTSRTTNSSSAADDTQLSLGDGFYWHEKELPGLYGPPRKPSPSQWYDCGILTATLFMEVFTPDESSRACMIWVDRRLKISTVEMTYLVFVLPGLFHKPTALRVFYSCPKKKTFLVLGLLGYVIKTATFRMTRIHT